MIDEKVITDGQLSTNLLRVRLNQTVTCRQLLGTPFFEITLPDDSFLKSVVIDYQLPLAFEYGKLPESWNIPDDYYGLDNFEIALLYINRVWNAICSSKWIEEKLKSDNPTPCFSEIRQIAMRLHPKFLAGSDNFFQPLGISQTKEMLNLLKDRMIGGKVLE
jgi:hypothetical protein